MQDWMQANWEMLVEAALPSGVFLEVYGEGADCNGHSSRVWRPEARATHVIVIKPASGSRRVYDVLSGENIEIDADGIAFDEFVALEGTWYARQPPFDCVLVERANGPVAFRINDVVFELVEARKG